ncbi:MAG: hypothetical protein JEZ07_17725 [Phycisphaerae bacterium]|nr:hypothetical protein [Phycisphaerae bacterium]
MLKKHIITLLIIVGMVLTYFTMQYFKERERVRTITKLLQEVGHKDLVSCCRALIEQKKQGLWEKESYTSIDSEFNDLPSEIIELKPLCVELRVNMVRIKILRFNGPAVHLIIMDKGLGYDGNCVVPLCEGLWYFDPKLKDDNYKDFINLLLSSRRRRVPAT